MFISNVILSLHCMCCVFLFLLVCGVCVCVCVTQTCTEISILTRIMLQGTTVVDNLLYSDDIRYMLDALRTLGLNVEDDNIAKRAIVEGCGGLFPVGKDGKEIELFLGNAGTAMRPLTAAVAVAGGNSRFVY